MKCTNKKTLTNFIYLGTCINSFGDILYLVKNIDNEKISFVNTIVLSEEEFKKNYIF